MLNLDIKLKNIKGIGENREEALIKNGIFNIQNLLEFYPRSYDNRTLIKSLNDIENDEKCTFIATVYSKPVVSNLRNKFSITKLLVIDNNILCQLVWFNQKYIKSQFRVGDRYYFYGKIKKSGKCIEVENPIFEDMSAEKNKKTRLILPIYRNINNISQSTIRNIIKNSIEEYYNMIEEYLPKNIIEKFDLIGLNNAIKNIHFPNDNESYILARKRLVFDEFFKVHLTLKRIKLLKNKDIHGIEFKKVNNKILLKQLPFELTNSQFRVLDEVFLDMESSRPMCRLIQGDVGSGKTIIAAMAIYKAILSGYQVAFMAPTEILAKQHFEYLNKLFKSFEIKIGILTGSLSKKNKDKIKYDLKNNKLQLIIGTHALIDDSVEFCDLGLIITDEQHRFGVNQRAKLVNKALIPDVLVMTATPIPRTLALILYGDLDISIIDELPVGRKEIKTYVVNESMRSRINNFILNEIHKRKQVYVICPLVDENDKSELKSAIKFSEELKIQLNDVKIGLIHGKLKAKEKETVIESFTLGEIDILVSTTVVEVGINIPNATLMIIENSERFGLAQLHQLRGRVGRGDDQSYCILYNTSDQDETKDRMRVMEETNDGFEISKKDLELRGPGDFFGTSQHGIPDFKIANLYKDIDILKKVEEAVDIILNDDLDFTKKENIKIKKLVDNFSRLIIDV